jgi:excisionase family DNA binding protein
MPDEQTEQSATPRPQVEAKLDRTSRLTVRDSENTREPLSLADRIERIGRAMTANELAEMLTVSRITIFKQAKAGRIPSFRIGTCVRFDPCSVAQWLRRN